MRKAMFARTKALEGAWKGLGARGWTAQLTNAAHDAKETEKKDAEGEQEAKKLLVVGGNGFVGGAVCREAVGRGMEVCSVSRSGRPPKRGGPWTKQVEWIAGDALRPSGWESELAQARAVISTVGAFGSNEFMEKMCGDANIEVMRAAAKAKVERFVFISAHEYGLPEFVLRGYFKGKRKAERVLMEEFPATGVALRPGFIYGNRQVGSVQVPLGLVGLPLEKVLRSLPADSRLKMLPLLSAVLAPPTSVTDVAKAAVTAATNNKVPSGLMDIYQIVEYAKM